MFNGEEKAVNESSDPVRGKIPATNELAVSSSGVMFLHNVLILWYCGFLLTLPLLICQGCESMSVGFSSVGLCSKSILF